MCLALDNAKYSSTSLWWKPVAVARLQDDFGTDLTQEMAAEAFEAHVRDFSKDVVKEDGHHEDEYIYRVIADSPEGRIFFHLTLDLDPDDPLITIESAHKPLG
jgi:hypothetical protein